MNPNILSQLFTKISEMRDAFGNANQTLDHKVEREISVMISDVDFKLIKLREKLTKLQQRLGND